VAGYFVSPTDFEALTQIGVPSQSGVLAAADEGLLDALDVILNTSLESWWIFVEKLYPC